MSDALEILETTSDQSELQRAAAEVADSTDEADHDALRRILQTSDFLDLLDAPEMLIAPPTHLRLANVLSALAENTRCASAHGTLVALTHDSEFTAARVRVELLILCLAEVRPSPPEAIDFWDRHFQSMDGYCHLTARAVLDNGSEPAIELFERKMLDPAIEESDKFYWLRTGVVKHRNNVHLLRCCNRLLQSALPDALRPVVVETLFDYRPDQWYTTEPLAVPPPRSDLSREGQVVLREVGRYALESIALSDTQRKVVRSVLTTLNAEKC